MLRNEKKKLSVRAAKNPETWAKGMVKDSSSVVLKIVRGAGSKCRLPHSILRDSNSKKLMLMVPGWPFEKS